MSTADPRPVHLCFNREFNSDEVPPEIVKALGSSPKQIIIARSWSELGKLMSLAPKTMCVHANELKYTSAVEIVNMIKTLAKLVGVDDSISISVGIAKETTYNEIKEFQKSNINSIIPQYYDFGLEESMKGLHAQWHGIPYWPRHIIDQLPGAKKQRVVENQLSEIRLTTRQQQILNLVVERGVSNKIIARTLNIGESTVKLHLGNIFKKYGVKNRTQLALFAQRDKKENQNSILPALD